MIERFIRNGSGSMAVRLRAFLVLLALPLIVLAAFFVGVAGYIKDFAQDFWVFITKETPRAYSRTFRTLMTGNPLHA